MFANVSCKPKVKSKQSQVKDGHALIARLTDEIAPEAVHQWRLEGEAGARGETRAVIKYLIRRRIAGATFRAQASHLLNRMATFFGADGPAEDGNAPRPGFRHRAEAERGYDTFDDAYTRFAGRGAWERAPRPGRQERRRELRGVPGGHRRAADRARCARLVREKAVSFVGRYAT